MRTTLALLLLLPTQSAADSITGRWQIRGDVVGNPVIEVCTIMQTDSILTGSCEGMGATLPLVGEVKEGRITFQHGGEYDGESLTIIFSGTLASPTEIRGTIQVQ